VQCAPRSHPPARCRCGQQTERSKRWCEKTSLIVQRCAACRALRFTAFSSHLQHTESTRHSAKSARGQRRGTTHRPHATVQRVHEGSGEVPHTGHTPQCKECMACSGACVHCVIPVAAHSAFSSSLTIDSRQRSHSAVTAAVERACVALFAGNTPSRLSSRRTARPPKTSGVATWCVSIAMAAAGELISSSAARAECSTASRPENP
jgi:hypothetical protein